MQVCGECGQRYERGGYCPADGTPLAATDDPLLGTEVGRYRLARLLGEGGMGRVYLAVQPMIGSRVAIKLLDETCARNPDLLERFFAEAKAVNLIRHENIVSVIDLAQLADGRPYIVMEFIEGQTLGDLVRSGPLPLGGVIQVMSEVMSALHAAHTIGIVHRDLKPDNIVVTGEGHAKVLDFGIAKLAPSLGQAISPRTRTGALLGTPAYMAPEQITGSGNIDPRTDIYAAGVVLFEATTGRPPFQTETLFDLMKAHLEQQPPLPRSLRADLPVELEQVILCALAKPPERRFPNAAAMAMALDAASMRLLPEQRRVLSSRGGVLGGRVPSTGSGRQADVPPAMQATVAATPVAKRRGKRNWVAIALLAIAAITTVIVLVAVRSDDSVVVARAPDPPKTEAPPPKHDEPAAPVKSVESPPAEDEPPPAEDKPKPVERAKTPPKHRDAAPPPATAPSEPAPKVAQLGPGEHEVPPPAGVHVEGNVHFIVKDPLAQTSRPADYNPKRFDPVAYLPKAEAFARQVLDDAQLTSFEFDPVYPDGHVELTGRDHEYDFRSPSKSTRPAGTPKNAKLDQPCRVHVEVTPTQIVAELRTSGTCTERIIHHPRCTFAQIWARAKAEHKVDNDMVVRIGWLYDEKWFFDTDPDTIRNGGGVNSFEDKCP